MIARSLSAESAPSSDRLSAAPVTTGARPRRIELLYSAECPSHPEALALLEAVLSEQQIDAAVKLHQVRSEHEAEVLSFPGSPTIRIDGVDIDPSGAKQRPSLSCRIYHLADGRISPVPSREQIEAALR